MYILNTTFYTFKEKVKLFALFLVNTSNELSFSLATPNVSDVKTLKHDG